jgi:thiamine biosynthesis lipoprotein
MSTSLFRERIFGTQVLLAGLAEPAAALTHLRELERLLSRFDPHSDLSRLNRTRRAAVHPLLVALLVEAVHWEELSGGLVSPFLGRPVAAHGYDRDFPSIASSGVPVPALPDVGGEVLIDVDASEVTLPGGVDVDLGGFAKGWAADRLRLSDPSPRGLVDIGGDIRAWSSDQPWRIGIAGGHADLLVLDAGVATSSTTTRSWWRAGQRRHHVIDPRTSRPSDSDLTQVSVVTGTAAAAEVGAKAGLITGRRHLEHTLSRLVPGARWYATDRTSAPSRPSLAAAHHSAAAS